jgi:hypothetical protein
MSVDGVGKAPEAVSIWVGNQLKIFLILDVFRSAPKKAHQCANGVPLGKAFSW